jgi:hypothetical protein
MYSKSSTLKTIGVPHFRQTRPLAILTEGEGRMIAAEDKIDELLAHALGSQGEWDRVQPR